LNFSTTKVKSGRNGFWRRHWKGIGDHRFVTAKRSTGGVGAEEGADGKLLTVNNRITSY